MHEIMSSPATTLIQCMQASPAFLGTSHIAQLSISWTTHLLQQVLQRLHESNNVLTALRGVALAQVGNFPPCLNLLVQAVNMID